MASAVALNYFIRFRYLEVYTTLKEPPLVKSDAKELHPDVNTTEPPPNFHNYLDDFLEAVRIFGFLEKPVFHELARHLQTRRLIAGDSISLDQDKNFYCVIDGLVQVYTKTGDTQADEGGWGEGSMNGYQLLNEVGSGGTLSSLFTILSLFTEDVRISWQDSATNAEHIDDPDSYAPRERTRLYRSDSDVSHIDLGNAGLGSSTTPTVVDSHSRRNPTISSPESTVLGSDTASQYSHRTRTQQRYSTVDHARLPEDSAVALEVEDATLAVIPAEAFRRLVKQFPKASAHIVQGAGSLYAPDAVTDEFLPYSNLDEILASDYQCCSQVSGTYDRSHPDGRGHKQDSLSSSTAVILRGWWTPGQSAPGILKPMIPTTMQHLRHRFDKKSGDDSPPDYFNFHRSSESINRITDDSVFTESPILTSQAPSGSSRESAGISRTHLSRHAVQAGDLHTTAGLNDPYRGIHRSFSTVGSGSRSGVSLGHSHVDEAEHIQMDEFDLKEEVMSCIAKSIGLHQPPISESDTGEASPSFSAVGSQTGGTRSPNAFTSFSSLTMLETADDVSSVTGDSTAVSSQGLGILDNEVEILYFAAGSTLARVGERHPGAILSLITSLTQV